MVAWDCFVIPRYLLRGEFYAAPHNRTVMHTHDVFIRLCEAALLSHQDEEHTAEGYVLVMERLWYRRWGPPVTIKIDLAGQNDGDMLGAGAYITTSLYKAYMYADNKHQGAAGAAKRPHVRC